MAAVTRLLLIGGGHAHLEVIRGLRQRLGADAVVDICCVDPQARAVYSGLVPAVLAGAATFTEASIDLQAACDHGGVWFLQGRVTALHFNADGGGTATVQTNDDESSAAGVSQLFDLLSVDIGGVSRDPCHFDENTLVQVVRTRPIGALAALSSSSTAGPVVIVGAGAAGVEIAGALRVQSTAAITLVAPQLLTGHHHCARRLVQQALSARAISFVEGAVVAVDGHDVVLAAGERLRAGTLLVATGVAAPPWLAETGLALDDRGFIRVDETLRSVSHPRVFAAGDVASSGARPPPKSGVHAVRAGPVLLENLTAILWQRRPRRRLSQRRFTMALISAGPTHATLSFGPLAFAGRLMALLKDRLDRRFVARHTIASSTTAP